MKLLMENWRKFINESGLSSIYKQIQEHECAVITAFRGDPSNESNCTENAVMYDVSNMNRNRDLKATLLSLNFGVTKVKGSYNSLSNKEAILCGAFK